MSLKGKVSAFSVFNSRRKSSSLTDVKTTPTKTPSGAKQKAFSTSNTPEKGVRHQKSSDVKKIKKLLKSATKKGGRPSYLPDSALQSPLSDLSHRNVKLKSLRPHGSTSNLNYRLPLKADSVIPVTTNDDYEGTTVIRNRAIRDSQTSGSKRNGATTPPLPPRGSRERHAVRVSTNHDYNFVLVNGNASPPTLKARAAPTTVKQKKASHSPKAGTSATVSRASSSRGSIAASNSNFGSKTSITTASSDVSATVTSKRRKTKQRKSTQAGDAKDKHAVIIKDTSDSDREPMSAYTRTTATHKHTPPYMYDSIQEASKLFECLIHPVKPTKFFSELWERKPLLVKRHMPNYNEGWFSTAELDRILREERVRFTENIDVVTYTNGVRETHNPVGRAYPGIVWDYYQNGCSVRLLNPQTYSRNVWKLLSILQEYFGSFVGANVYLTPPDTQGFAPHYDDIEAFILQLEGRKHWRLYTPKKDSDVLPRYSSNNFTDADIGDPILDVILEAGDLLYFPRGCVHQGKTLGDTHSLHITVSCCQQNTWGDLLEKLVPRALQVAFEEDVEFRKALPTNYLNYMGVAFSDLDNPERKVFLRHMQQLMMKLLGHAPVDAAVDQMAKKFISETLPPVLTEGEKSCSIHGSGEHWHAVGSKVKGSCEIEPDNCIKLIRKCALRLVTEDEKVVIYHNIDNGRTYKQFEPQVFEITPEMAPGVEFLLHSYPHFIAIDNLPLETVDEKITLASVLYDKGLIITKEPLTHLSDTSSDECDEDSDEDDADDAMDTED